MARTIIIGMDGSDQGRDALALGGVLAETLAATPLVVAALPYPHNLMGPADLERTLELDTRDLFAVVRDELQALGPRTRAIASSSPGEALYRLAEVEDAVAVVVGSTHRGALGRVFPGSVGTNLLQGAPCAVAVAPRGYATRTKRRLLRLLVAFDGSPEAWTALETAIGLARRFHASLTLVTVVEPPGYGYGEALSVLSAGELHTHDQAEKQKVLDLGLDRVPKGIPVEGRLINGEAAEAIAAASDGFDLVVLGSRGYGPLRRALLGSASAEVMRRAECPVLVSPRAAGVDPLGLHEQPGEGGDRRTADLGGTPET